MASLAPMRRHYRSLVTTAALCGALALGLATGGTIGLVDGTLYDLSLTLPFGRSPPPTKPVAVVAIDAKSLASERLAAVPRVFLGPYFAKLADGLFAARARAIGFDVLFNYAPSRFPAIDKDYDLPFLDALARHRDKIVLARSAGTPVIDPVAAAVWNPARDGTAEEPTAIAYAELSPSEDGVVRRVLRAYRAEDGAELPTFASRLVERAGGPAMPDQFLLAPRARLETIPTYSLSDVLACIETSPDSVARLFADRIVLVGGVLPEEDRKQAPDRFLPAPALPRPAEAGCAMPPLGISDPQGRTVSGVSLQAAVVEGVLTGEIVRPVPRAVQLASAAVMAAIGCLFGLLLGPGLALGALTATLAALFLVSAALLGGGVWLPIAVPALAAGGGSLAVGLARFLAVDRRRRRVERAFAHYLAPAIVDRLADDEAQLQLGGEAREVTVFFADLSGFTELSGEVPPAELMRIGNAYLGVIVAAVEATGGYVDKFLGDAVMALWGAPAAERDHAAAAARSALSAVRSVRAFNARPEMQGKPSLDLKIGFASGPAVVGNVGSARRLNYTAIGETVNIAARLEKVCGDYGCSIVTDARARELLAQDFLLCEIDTVAVKGKREPIAVFALLDETADVSNDERNRVERYSEALHLFRNGHLAAAEALWRSLAQLRSGPLAAPARLMAERARPLVA